VRWIVTVIAGGLLALLGAGDARAANCRAVAITGISVRTLSDLDAISGRAGSDRVAFFIRIHGASCPQAQTMVTAVLQSKDETTALAGGGFRRVKVTRERAVAGHAAYSVEAVQGAQRLRYWRFGKRAEVDHTIYRAGQWVDVYGARVHEQCTASWVLQPAAGPPVGLTAGHCRPERFIEAAPVLRSGHRLGDILVKDPAGLDAATFSLDPAIPVAQQVERGERLPLTAVGWVRSADQHRGDPVCFAGRTTGADQCGRIVHRYSLVPHSLTCTDIEDHQGDSGGPVYTPGKNGTTRALGIVSVAVRKGLGSHRRLCYLPIEPILNAFGARFPAGPLVRAQTATTSRIPAS
jgi:hypothetical protein